MARRPIIQAGAFGENWQVPVPVPQFRYRYQQLLGDQGNRYSDGYDGKVDIILAATRRGVLGYEDRCSNMFILDDIRATACRMGRLERGMSAS